MTVSAPGGRQTRSLFFEDDVECGVMSTVMSSVMSTSTPDTALLLASPNQVGCHWGEFFRVIWGDNHDKHMVNTSNNTTINLSDGQR